MEIVKEENIMWKNSFQTIINTYANELWWHYFLNHIMKGIDPNHIYVFYLSLISLILFEEGTCKMFFLSIRSKLFGFTIINKKHKLWYHNKKFILYYAEINNAGWDHEEIWNIRVLFGISRSRLLPASIFIRVKIIIQ